MGLIEELKGLGVNVDDGLDRVMGDHSLYEMILGMFLDSVKDHPISPEDFDGIGLEELIKRVHTLKGVTANLSLTPLTESYTTTLGLLREGQAQEAKAEFESMMPVQATIIDCIKRYRMGS